MTARKTSAPGPTTLPPPTTRAATLQPNSTAPELTEESKKIAKNKPHWLLPFAALFNTLLIIASLLLNLIIVTYYWNNHNNLSSTLYLRNGIADSICAIGFLVQVPLALRE